jgi:transcriptional regulator with GAF, ATPase, and Fis domain
MSQSDINTDNCDLLNTKEQLAQKEKEFLILQGLATEFAAARDKQDLLAINRERLRSVYGFGENGVGVINHDSSTMSYFLSEPDSITATHSNFATMSHAKYPLADGILDRTLDSPEPVLFDLQEIADRGGLPEYLQIHLEGGISKVLMTRLCTGDKVVGVWGITFTNMEPISEEQIYLVKYISHLMAIAVSNVLANEDIQRRELEREILLSLSIDTASVRTTEELMALIRLKLKALLEFTNTGMTFADQEKMTCKPVLVDPNSTARSHPEYVSAYSHVYPIYDGLGFEQAYATDKPVVFSLEDLAKQGIMPLYVKIPYESGLRTLCITRLCHRGEILGFWMIYYANEGSLDDSRLRLIGGLANQLSIALSNIIANEIIDRNLQAIKHQKQQLKEEKIYLMEEIAKSHNSWDIVGESKSMEAIFQLVRQVAGSDSTVLILGETGTGKELIARAIHNHSPRRQKMMVKVNCAALPPQLIESELFGHERGSFTGATDRRIGKFELAHDGTLFLDEVGELPLELQSKLLRALQEREIERVGGKTTIKVNVRIVAATNRDLEKEMIAGRFRRDLYYRLNIFPIQLPPLRERMEDVPVLATHFIKLHTKKIGKRIKALNTKIMDELMNYDWPGNIRELENILERSVLLASGDTIQKVYLPATKYDLATHSEIETVLRLQSLADNEKQHILSILKYCGGRISGKDGAAAILGVPPSTLISRMKRLGIKKEHVDGKKLAMPS